MKPQRIQRKRTKGYDMQKASPNGLPVVSVTRPGKWGNPLILKGDMIYIDASYRRSIVGKYVYLCNGDIYKLLDIFRDIIFLADTDNPDIRYWQEHFKKLDFRELEGKNIACFCAEGAPCHGNVYIKIANP